MGYTPCHQTWHAGTSTSNRERCPSEEKTSMANSGIFQLAMFDYRRVYGYGSIPINTIFRGMNIHLPAILMWTTGVQGFDTLPYEWAVLILAGFDFPRMGVLAAPERLQNWTTVPPSLGWWWLFLSLPRKNRTILVGSFNFQLCILGIFCTFHPKRRQCWQNHDFSG